MPKFQAVGDNIIVKIFIKKSKAGIIIPTDSLPTDQNSKLQDNNRYSPIAEVYSVGNKVKSVKPGDKLVFMKPHFLVLNFEEICGEPCGEKVGYVFSKMKEEDVLGVITKE